MLELSPVYLAGEGQVILKLSDTIKMVDALALLVGSYYVFNVEYPVSSRNIFMFLEMTMLERAGDIFASGLP